MQNNLQNESFPAAAANARAGEKAEQVLILDDDEAMLAVLEGVLTGAGYVCRTRRDGHEALALIEAEPAIAVVLSDIFMPGLTGLEFVNQLNSLRLDHPRPRVLLLTGQPSLETAVDALRLGARDFLVKPVRLAELTEAVGRAMSQARQDRLAAAMRPAAVGALIQQAEELAGRLRTLVYANEQRDIDAAEAAMSQSLASLTRVPVVPARAGGQPRGAAAAQPGRQPARPSVLDTIEHLRKLRNRYDEHKIDEVGWDLLLELLRAERLHQRLSVSGLTISIESASPTTSLRRVNELTARGYLARHADPEDARRDFVSLTPVSHELLADYLARANAHLLELTGVQVAA